MIKFLHCMSLFEQLIQTIKKNYPNANLDMVQLAFEFADEAHKGQLRVSGEPYINHSLNTAIILAEMKLNPSIVIAGLLHDVPEDTNVTLKEIEKNFGKDIALMVEGITKLGKLKYRGVERYAENLRKMFLAMSRDIRTIFIKFADRLDNLKTLYVLPPEKQRRIALEVIEIYAPIANRLGMGEIQGRLEDEAFRYLSPNEYQYVKSIIDERALKKEDYIQRICEIVKDELKKYNINVIDVHGRIKHVWSLYRKLLRYNWDLGKIHDILAVRVIVSTLSDCYGALGIIHQRWKPLKGRIKDYIAQPKPNGYQSLHTTVFCEEGEIVEIQIRTQKMHEEAEYGVAAHWFYDEKGKKDDITPPKLKWLKELVDLQKKLKNSKSFLESLEEFKVDIFQNRIFVFTPKGDVIELPEDSTPVDFAYAVHSEIGNKCVGAKVNEEMVSLDTKLRSGDIVEIIIDKNRKKPSADWLSFVKTKGARDKIKAAVKQM
jgi:GTP pyrophosphokinase